MECTSAALALLEIIKAGLCGGDGKAHEKHDNMRYLRAWYQMGKRD